MDYAAIQAQNSTIDVSKRLHQMWILHGASVWPFYIAKKGYFGRSSDIFCNIGVNCNRCVRQGNVPKAESLYLLRCADCIQKRLWVTVPEGVFYLGGSFLKMAFDRKIIYLSALRDSSGSGGEHSLSYSHSKPGSFRLTGSLRGSGIFSIAAYPVFRISPHLSCYPARNL